MSRENQLSAAAAVASLRPCRYAAPLWGRPPRSDGGSAPPTISTTNFPDWTPSRNSSGIHLNHHCNLSKVRGHLSSKNSRNGALVTVLVVSVGLHLMALVGMGGVQDRSGGVERGSYFRGAGAVAASCGAGAAARPRAAESKQLAPQAATNHRRFAGCGDSLVGFGPAPGVGLRLWPRERFRQRRRGRRGEGDVGREHHERALRRSGHGIKAGSDSGCLGFGPQSPARRLGGDQQQVPGCGRGRGGRLRNAARQPGPRKAQPGPLSAGKDPGGRLLGAERGLCRLPLLAGRATQALVE